MRSDKEKSRIAGLEATRFRKGIDKEKMETDLSLLDMEMMRRKGYDKGVYLSREKYI